MRIFKAGNPGHQDRPRAFRGPLTALSFTLCACLLAACGSDIHTASAGSIYGTAFRAVDAVSFVRAPVDGGSSLAIYAINVPGACAWAQSGKPAGGWPAALLEVYVGTASGGVIVPPTGPGTFPIEVTTSPHGPLANAIFGAFDAQGMLQHGSDTTSGTVTLDSVDSSGTTGSAELDFTSGDHLSVQFNAPHYEVK